MRHDVMEFPTNPAQQIVLIYAHHYAGGKVVWFPDCVTVDSRVELIQDLICQGLIAIDETGVALTALAQRVIESLNISPMDPAFPHVRYPGSGKAGGKTYFKPGTKRAFILELLMRREGVTISEISDKVGWSRGTVSALLSLTFKQHLGIPITSSKGPGRTLTYRVNNQTLFQS